MNINIHENEIELSPESQAEIFQLEAFGSEMMKNFECKKIIDGKDEKLISIFIGIKRK